MAILIKLINDYDVWLYGTLALVALFLLRAAILARRDRLQATFSLEREAARNREMRIMTGAIVCLLLVAGIYALVRFVTPNVAIPYEPTPTVTPLFLPTVTSTPATETPTPTQTARPTPRPTVSLGTPTPTATPRPAPAACANPGVNLTAPGLFAEVKGVVQVAGSAAIERFQYYKLEFGDGDNPAQWTFLLSANAPVYSGNLGAWDTGPLPAGVYALRLVVVDQTGNFPEPCKVVVTIAK